MYFVRFSLCQEWCWQLDWNPPCNSSLNRRTTRFTYHKFCNYAIPFLFLFPFVGDLIDLSTGDNLIWNWLSLGTHGMGCHRHDLGGLWVYHTLQVHVFLSSIVFSSHVCVSLVFVFLECLWFLHGSLCSGFWPTLSVFLQRIPIIGWLFQQPYVTSVWQPDLWYYPLRILGSLSSLHALTYLICSAFPCSSLIDTEVNVYPYDHLIGAFREVCTR